MRVVLRDAEPADASAISHLIASLEHHRAPDLSVAPPAGFLAGYSVDVLSGILADPRFRYLVALVDESIVGVLGIRDCTIINHFFVATPCQEQGIARQLWLLAWKKALLDGEKRLRVNSSLMAVPVYRKFGFQEVGPVVHAPGFSYVPMERLPAPFDQK